MDTYNSTEKRCQETSMELTVDQMLQQGLSAPNAGNPKEAERLYRAILHKYLAINAKSYPSP